MLPVLPIDPYAQYIETMMFQLAQQQRITNWAGTVAQQAQYADYQSKVQLCDTTSRPLRLNDEILFLHSDQHQLTPHQTWDTLCYMCQLQYRIVHIDNGVIFSDYVEFFSAPHAVTLDAAAVPMTMRCHYAGTYLLRMFNADGLEGSASSSAAQQQQSNLGKPLRLHLVRATVHRVSSAQPTGDHQH